MADLVLQLRPRDGAQRLRERIPLDVRQLAEPVVAAGRDWLRLQGEDASVDPYVAWTVDGNAGCLTIELRAGAGALWHGHVTGDELSRVASRAAKALFAAGLWPPFDTSRGDELTWRLALADHDAVDARPLDTNGAGGLGIECAPVAPPAIETMTTGVFEISATLLDPGDPDLTVVFHAAVLGDIVRALDESARAREERALLLFGRRLRTRAGDGFRPLFEITATEKPGVREASATRIVLEHSSLMSSARPGSGARGLLHTHLPQVPLVASDPDRRDIDDLDAGGPSAFSVICHARERTASAPIAWAFYARLGAYGGEVREAAARVLVAEPRHLPESVEQEIHP